MVSMGVNPVTLVQWLRIMGINRPKASLNNELQRAGICAYDGDDAVAALFFFSEQQLEMLFPCFNLGERRILRACAETEQGNKLFADYYYYY